MLQYAALSGGMSVLVHHTDDQRKFAYTKHTDKVMPLAEKEGWTVIDTRPTERPSFPGGDVRTGRSESLSEPRLEPFPERGGDPGGGGITDPVL